MANICICEIRAAGPQSDMDEVKRLLDASTTFSHGAEITSFSEIVGIQLRQGWGRRGYPSVGGGDIVWIGELDWSPPSEFVEEMSKRFPATTLRMKSTVLDGADRMQTYEFKNGSSRLIHEADGDFEFRGHDASPVDHWRGSLRFNSLVELEGVMQSLRASGLIFDMDGHVCSEETSEVVSQWIENRFPETDFQINWWLPYCPIVDGVSPEHALARYEFRDECEFLAGPKPHDWIEDGF